MATVQTVHVMDVYGDEDTTKYQTLTVGDRTVYTLGLPGNVHLFFAGHDGEGMAHLLSFLDAMHAIRNCVLQDAADSANTGEYLWTCDDTAPQIDSR